MCFKPLLGSSGEELCKTNKLLQRFVNSGIIICSIVYVLPAGSLVSRPSCYFNCKRGPAVLLASTALSDSRQNAMKLTTSYVTIPFNALHLLYLVCLNHRPSPFNTNLLVPLSQCSPRKFYRHTPLISKHHSMID